MIQLQDVINNINSLQLSTRESQLKQDFQNNLNMRYSGVNTEKSHFVFALLGGNYSNNYIGNSTLIANRDTVVYNSIVLKRTQITRPVEFRRLLQCTFFYQLYISYQKNQNQFKRIRFG